MTKKALLGGGVLVIIVVLVTVGIQQLPALGAGGLLHPSRRPVNAPLPSGCDNAQYAGDDVALIGWRCRARGTPRATIIYLHGIADNRASSRGVISRFVPRGFDVIAYDSRAHGDSQGVACTYGFFEKRDLRRVADTLAPGPIVLIGTSLGAAVALQEAADDPRVSAIVAAEPFSDLRTVAAERAPFVFTSYLIERAFTLAEQRGHFIVDDVSSVKAATRIHIPVLLVHGDSDVDTRPDHSRRILAALAGPKRLILVPGAHHNQSLNNEVWSEIDRWLDDVLR